VETTFRINIAQSFSPREFSTRSSLQRDLARLWGQGGGLSSISIGVPSYYCPRPTTTAGLSKEENRISIMDRWRFADDVRSIFSLQEPDRCSVTR
jgi:hypothetical protein